MSVIAANSLSLFAGISDEQVAILNDALAGLRISFVCSDDGDWQPQTAVFRSFDGTHLVVSPLQGDECSGYDRRVDVEFIDEFDVLEHTARPCCSTCNKEIAPNQKRCYSSALGYAENGYDWQLLLSCQRCYRAPSCFIGFTQEHEAILNSLHGYRVKVRGGGIHDDGSLKEYIFSHMVGIGEGHMIQCPGDLILFNIDSDGGASASSRVVSSSLVSEFIFTSRCCIICECSQCGRHIASDEKTWDVGRLSNHKLPDGEWEWSQRIECNDCWYSGSW